MKYGTRASMSMVPVLVAAAAARRGPVIGAVKGWGRAAAGRGVAGAATLSGPAAWSVSP